MNWISLCWSFVSLVVRAIARLFSSPDASPPTVPSVTLPPNVSQPEPEPVVQPPPPSLPPTPLLVPFCLAIQSREGFFKPGENKAYPHGTRAWKNNNPGNIKYGPFAKNCGAIGQDDKGFAVFPSYEKGFTALKTLVTNAATGKSDIYKPTDSIFQFFSRYAPSTDHNDPQSYANEVALKLGVPTSFQISGLV